MNTTDRRQWLKTFGLGSGFALLGGFESLALEPEDKSPIFHRPAKLNANENPYGPSKRIRAILSNTFDEACRYPFAKLRTLVEAIAEKEGVTKDHIVVCGGSTEGLRAAGMLYGMGDREIIAADPTFQALMRYGENFGAKVHRVPLTDELQHDLDAMGQKVNAKTGLVYICNPNNPTGTLLDSDKLKDFCSSFQDKAVIFSDEAYYDYIMEPDYPSMVEFIKEGHNIIVSKTFSKVFGLAGLRIGYLIAKPEMAAKLKSSIMANTNVLAIEAAKEALKDDSFYKFSLAKNAEAKKHIYQTLDDLSLPYITSHTNFVFFKSGRPIDQLIAAMKEEEVIIGRPFPPLYDWARISTGTMPDMERFRKGLSAVMSR